MNPAYSVILFTTASGAGYGLLALLGVVGFNHGPASSTSFALTALIIAVGLITIGLLSSTFHLGNPSRAWRAFSQWRTSWLSREGVVAVLTYPVALGFGAVWSGVIEAPKWIALLGFLTAMMCAATVFCTAMIYASLKTIRAWNNKLTVPIYLVFALATGSALLTAIATAFGRFQIFQVILTLAALTVAALLKFLYWRNIDHAPRIHTMESASGLGHLGAVSQWEVPHTAQNFIQKEMGYVVARRHAEKLRLAVIGLLLLAVVLLLATIQLPLFSLPAAIVALAAAIVERWLFFAEAQHVVQLYYGAKSA